MPKFLFQLRYFNCIVAVKDEEGNFSFKKYHNVRNTELHKSKFLAFAKNKFPGATHVNFYSKETRSFIERIYLE